MLPLFIEKCRTYEQNLVGSGAVPFTSIHISMYHILKYERNFSQNNEMPPPPPEEEDEDVDQCRGDDMKRCMYL